MRKLLCTSLFIAALFLNGCAVSVPNLEAVSGVQNVPGVAALAQRTNTDARRRLTLDEWLDFLYAQPERPDPANHGGVLPAKGPAVCLSSVDWARNETALADLCARGSCSYEQVKALERMRTFREEVNAP